jgi:hypothetical protein
MWRVDGQLQVCSLTTLIFRCIYQETTNSRLWTMIPQTPAIQRILFRSQALSAALQYIEAAEAAPRGHVIQLVERSLGSFEPTDNPGRVERAAMGLIVGRPEHIKLEPAESLDQRVFTIVGQAWISWATSVETEEAQRALSQLPAPRGPQPEGGALHLMALQPWAAAVSALIHDDSLEAQRMFRRATELASQCGTETNSAVQWTYAASYFVR